MDTDLEVSSQQLDEAARASLHDLADLPVDNVIALIDQPLHGYRQLYYRWERQQWESGTIDFTEDRRQWLEDFSRPMRKPFQWALSSFYVGDQMTNALVPFVDAAPTEEQQVFLTTQLADEARHTVFFDRFYDEVLDEGTEMDSHREAGGGGVSSGYRILLLEMLPEVTERIRRLDDPDALVEGIVLYHIVVEATIALTGQRFLLNHARRERLLPGFRQGLTAIARDESRHVAFAIRFLKEMVTNDARCARVIEEALTKFVPIGMSVIDPPNKDLSYFEALPYGPEDLSAFAMNGLSKRLRAIGVTLPA